MPMFVDGFSVHRRKIFGFGPNSEDNTNNVLKISSVKGPNKRKLDKAPVTNLAEQQSVGYINYKLKNIRGRKQLESAPKKMVIKKSFDLIEKSYQEDSAMSMSKYVKPAKVIREIKLEWNERLKKQQAEGYSARELINTKNESTKCNCLDYLKSQTIPGPFTMQFKSTNT